MTQNTPTQLDYTEKFRASIRVPRPRYREYLDAFLTPSADDETSLLLLRGDGGLGKTVLTEMWDIPADDWLQLKLEFNLEKQTHDDAAARTVVTQEDQDDFTWGRCLNKLQHQLTNTKRAKTGRPPLRIFEAFFDHAISRDNTSQRRAKLRPWLTGFSVILSAICIFLAAAPDLLHELTGHTLSGRELILLLTLAVLLQFAAIPGLVAAILDWWGYRPHFRKLKMSPRDFRDPNVQDDAGSAPLITPAETSRVFTYDLRRWWKRKGRRAHKRGILLVIDIHSFVDKPDVRNAFIDGLKALLGQARDTVHSGQALPLKCLVLSKSPALYSEILDSGAGADVASSAITVTQFQYNEAIRMVVDAFQSLPTDALADGSYGALVAEAVDKVAHSPDGQTLPGTNKTTPRDEKLGADILRALISGTDTDKGDRAPEAVLSRIACFLSGAATEQPAKPLEDKKAVEAAFNHVKSQLNRREYAYLRAVFADQKSFDSVRFLALFDWGLTEAEWPPSDEAPYLLTFQELLELPQVTTRFDHLRNAPVAILKYDTYLRFRAAPQYANDDNVWTALGETFNLRCAYLGLKGNAKPKEIGVELGKLFAARQLLACVREVADHERYHIRRGQFEQFYNQTGALLKWVLHISAIRADQLPDDVSPAFERVAPDLLEQAAVTACHLIAPRYPGSGDGILRRPDLFIEALKVISEYMNRQTAYKADRPSTRMLSESFKQASYLAKLRLEHEQTDKILEAYSASDKAIRTQCDKVRDTLSKVHETPLAEHQMLRALQQEYADKKVRTPNETRDAFYRFSNMSLASLPVDEQLDYLEVLRKLGNSVASTSLNDCAPDERDVAYAQAVHDQFISPTLERLQAAEVRLADAGEHEKWRLRWYQLRTLLYWLAGLKKFLPDTATEVPANLTQTIDELVTGLSAIAGRPGANDLRDMRDWAKGDGREFPALRDRLLGLHDGAHLRGLDQRLARANALLDAQSDSQDTPDVQPAFQELVALFAMSFWRTNKAESGDDEDLQRLRLDARAAYAKAVLENWYAHPGRRKGGDGPGPDALDADARMFAEEIARIEADEPPVQGAMTQIAYKTSDAILSLLARHNPSRADARPGTVIVAQIRPIKPGDGHQQTTSNPHVWFDVPHSDLDIGVSRNLWPTGLNNQAVGMPPNKRYTHDDWSGKQVFAILLKNDQSHTRWPATLKGLEYAQTCVQMVAPFVANWSTLWSLQRSGSNHKPQQWIGASRSWLVLRSRQDWIDAILENHGMFTRMMPKLTALWRLSYFARADDMALSDDEKKELEISRFVHATYRELRYYRAANGEVRFFRPVGEKPPAGLHADPYSHSKNRTFLEMCNRVFGLAKLPTIDDWTDPRLGPDTPDRDTAMDATAADTPET